MSRSIKTAVTMAENRPLVLVLADMRELGAEAKMRHEELGEIVREIEPEAVFFKGDHTKDVRRGLDGFALTELHTPNDFLEAWREMGLEEAVVLVKGSRSCKMEEYANVLCRELADTAGTQGGLS
jgi:UDP-N-acetylmuramoyl-tripeptide--D-alanyl-D-alanine ligase